MTDREKVVKGLECCHVQRNEAPPLCEDCPYMNPMEGTCDALDELLGDALTLLKEQQPRVMTLGEACSDIDFCWLEIKDYQAVWVSDCVMMPNGRQVLIERLGCDPVAFKPEDYGKTWRCWTSRPTDAQRKATAWNN